MKKFFVTLFVFVLLSLQTTGKEKEIINLGLVSQLVEIKYVSEIFSSKIVADTSMTKLQKETALANYNEERMQSDRIICQLTADMIENNSIRIYRRLNKFYSNHTLSETKDAESYILKYVTAINDLYNCYITNIKPDKEKLKIELITAATVISAANLSWTIIKGINDKQGKKVDGVIEVLNNLRLNAPPEILKVKK